MQCFHSCSAPSAWAKAKLCVALNRQEGNEHDIDVSRHRGKVKSWVGNTRQGSRNCFLGDVEEEALSDCPLCTREVELRTTREIAICLAQFFWTSQEPPALAGPLALAKWFEVWVFRRRRL
jgi:hypothetical protein